MLEVTAVVYLYSVTDHKTTAVTSSMTNSFGAQFDPEGKYLYYLSDRDFNEVLGNIDFEFANPKTTRVYVVTLSKDEPSPFKAQSDETEIKKTEPGKMGAEENAAAEAKPKSGAKKKEEDKSATDQGQDKDREK